ncbi:MAG: hypothetical protein N2491_08635 [Negativicutes bacterium]|nr:hypothetical protein [Negativicutes bacterium]
MAKPKSKREYHRQDMDKVNRTALMIGGAVAALILLVMIVSAF